MSMEVSFSIPKINIEFRNILLSLNKIKIIKIDEDKDYSWSYVIDFASKDPLWSRPTFEDTKITFDGIAYMYEKEYSNPPVKQLDTFLTITIQVEEIFKKVINYGWIVFHEVRKTVDTENGVLSEISILYPLTEYEKLKEIYTAIVNNFLKEHVFKILGFLKFLKKDVKIEMLHSFTNVLEIPATNGKTTWYILDYRRYRKFVEYHIFDIKDVENLQELFLKTLKIIRESDKA